jgi:tetratricopeptide (TPR) repeat protein
MIGRLLGHYRVVERLGAGGMGVVYRARDERLQRDVALKVLPEGVVTDERLRGSLHREALALSRTAHPHIATVFDFDRQAGVDFLVMEFVPGPTLADRLASGPLGEDEAVQLAAQLADGLAAAHAQGIVHRDLKPSNVKLTADGRLKILDFGIARLLPRPDERTLPDSDRTGGAGSLPYMAPELLRGAPADVRSDLYAVGVLLYELVTGRRPFRAENDVALIEAIVTKPPEPPSRLTPTLSPELERIILKALDKDPARRYQSAVDLRVDLERLARRAERPTLSTHGARTRVGRAPRRQLAGAGILAAGVGALLVWLWPTLRAPSPPPAGGARIRLAVLAPMVAPGSDGPEEWPVLLQSLVAGELTGVPELAVIDPLSLNGQLQTALGTTTPLRGPELMRELDRAQVAMALDATLLSAGPVHRIQWNLLDVRTGELAFTHSTTVQGEADLGRAASELAARLLAFLQVRGLDLAKDRDLRPWLALRRQNVEAVKAFVQASQFMYRYEPGAEKHLRRAIELDPSFIAPRLWLVSALVVDNRFAEAREQLERLTALESRASPFEQAMIGYAAALLSQDLEGQARHLEIALEYSPGNHILLINLAGVYLLMDDCPRALEVLDPLVASRWSYPPLYTVWGWCGLDTGRFASTRATLEQVRSSARLEPIVDGLLEVLALATGDEAAAARYGAAYDRHPLPHPQLDLGRAFARAAARCRQTGRAREAAALEERARIRFAAGPRAQPR